MSHIKVFDTNNEYSFGPFQFQKSTFVEAVRKYDLLPHAEDPELMNMIYDYEFTKDLARRLVLDGEEWRWKNCVRKVGQPPIPE